MKPWTSAELDTRLRELARLDGDADERLLVRRRILEVATEHFARFGYRRASVGDIAHDAGLGKGTLYLHFDSKKTLLMACVAHEKMALVPQLEAVMARPASERLEAYIRMGLTFMFDAPLSAAIVRGDRELKLLMSHRDAVDDRDKTLDLVTSMLPPTLDLDDAARAEIAAVLSAVLPLVAHLVDTERRLGLDRQRFVDVYTRILARGAIAGRGA